MTSSVDETTEMRVTALHSFPFATSPCHDRLSSCLYWSSPTVSSSSLSLVNNRCRRSQKSISTKIGLIVSNNLYMFEPGTDEKRTTGNCLFFNKDLITIERSKDDKATSSSPKKKSSQSKDESPIDKYCNVLGPFMATFQDRFLVKMDPFVSKLTHPFKESLAGIRSLEWSPDHSLLAVLMVNYEVVIFKESNCKWVPLIGLSKKIKEQIESQVIPELRELELCKEKFSQVKRHLYKCALTCITWWPEVVKEEETCINDSENCSSSSATSDRRSIGGSNTMVLMAGSKSGNIYFIGITMSNESIDGDVRIITRRTICDEKDPDPGHISCIKPCSGFLWASTTSGKLFLTPICDLIKSLATKTTSSHHCAITGTGDPSSPKKSKRGTIDSPALDLLQLWNEQDDICSEHFLIINDKEEDEQETPTRNSHSSSSPGTINERHRFTLIACKATFLLMIKVTIQKNSKNNKWSIIDHLQLLGLTTAQMSFTGICWTCDLQVILASSADGRVLRIKLPPESEFISPKSDLKKYQLDTTELVIDSSFPSYAHIAGLATSPCGLMSAVLQKIIAVHDLAKVPKPNLMTIFSNITADQVLERLDLFESDNSCQESSFEEMFECILCLRGFLDTNSFPHLVDFNCDSINDNLTTNALKIKRHHAMAIKTHLDKSVTNTERSQEIPEVIKKLEQVIFKRHASSIIELAESSASLSDQEKDSVIFVRQILELLASQTSKPEKPKTKCPICGQGFPEVLSGDLDMVMDVAICTNGHKWSRCSNSSLPIDFNTSSRIKCAMCHKVSLKKSIWPKFPSCIFCDPE